MALQNFLLHWVQLKGKITYFKPIKLALPKKGWQNLFWEILFA